MKLCTGKYITFSLSFKPNASKIVFLSLLNFSSESIILLRNKISNHLAAEPCFYTCYRPLHYVISGAKHIHVHPAVSYAIHDISVASWPLSGRFCSLYYRPYFCFASSATASSLIQKQPDMISMEISIDLSMMNLWPWI